MSAQIILASSSKWRRQVLAEVLEKAQGPLAASALSCIAPDIDEKAIRDPDVECLVLRIAQAKCDAVAARLAAASPPPQPTPTGNESDSKSGPFLVAGDQVTVYTRKAAVQTVTGAEGNESPADIPLEASSVQMTEGNLLVLEKPVDAAQCRVFLRAYAHYHVTTVSSIVIRDVSTGREVRGVDRNTVHFSAIPDALVDQMIANGDCLQCCGGFVVEQMGPAVAHIDGSVQGVQGLNPTLAERLLREIGALPATP